MCTLKKKKKHILVKLLKLILWNKLENWGTTNYTLAIIQDYTITQVPKGLPRMTEKPWFSDKCIIYANSFAARKGYILVREETFIFSISYHREHSNYNSTDICLLSFLALTSPNPSSWMTPVELVKGLETYIISTGFNSLAHSTQHWSTRNVRPGHALSQQKELGLFCFTHICL